MWLVEFIFPRKLRRFSYFIRVVTTNGGTAFLYANNWLMNPWLCLCLIVALAIYSVFFIALPRIRDIGMNVWWVLVCFIPGVNIVFGIILLLRESEYRFGTSSPTVEPKTE